MDRIEVTAADYNGKSFDGYPFSHTPQWLHDAIENELITGVNPNTTDYLEWAVLTINNELVYAGPGDQIVNTNGTLSVIKWNKDY